MLAARAEAASGGCKLLAGQAGHQLSGDRASGEAGSSASQAGPREQSDPAPGPASTSLEPPEVVRAGHSGWPAPDRLTQALNPRLTTG